MRNEPLRRKSVMTRAVALFGLVAIVLAGCGGADEAAEVSPEAPVESAPDSAPTAPDASDEAPDAPAEDAEQGTEASEAPGAGTRPEGFPAEMPLPEGAAYSFSAGPVEYFWVERPVAEVIEELETLLPAHGWEILEVQPGVAWEDDQLFEVEGHGLRMFVFAEPSAGSETETAISFGSR